MKKKGCITFLQYVCRLVLSYLSAILIIFKRFFENFRDLFDNGMSLFDQYGSSKWRPLFRGVHSGYTRREFFPPTITLPFAGAA